MRDGKGGNLQIVEEKALARADDDAVLRRKLAHGAVHALPGTLGGVDGQAQPAGKHAHALDVIAVLVGDEQRLEARGVQPRGAQRVQHLAAAHAAIHQQRALIGGKVNGVAAGTAE